CCAFQKAYSIVEIYFHIVLTTSPIGKDPWPETFPHAYKRGEGETLGAFLIPFTIMLVIAGLPLMFMELSFGQYANLGPVAIYKKFCPLFRGLGYGMVIVSAIVMLYYNLIIAWTIFYMFASFSSVLPWEKCEEWSTIKHIFNPSFTTSRSYIVFHQMTVMYFSFEMLDLLVKRAQSRDLFILTWQI
ncbi:hypothetical protein L9F63_021785, partial [Diploptera punctata]